MTKGIYFLDKNQSLLSDLESFFIVNDMVSYLGGTGLKKAPNVLAAALISNFAAALVACHLLNLANQC